VVAFDTHVLVRVLLGDDPEQTPRAERAFQEHCDGAGVYVSVLVLAEIAWVLSTGYDLDRPTAHERLSSLVRTRGVFVEQVEMVLEALGAFGAGGAELAEQFILRGARLAGAAPLLSFDRKLLTETGVIAP
jgi:predicted nucleic-acid-binding protein